MAINKPIIAAGPVSTRSNAKTLAVKTVSAIPPTPYLSRDSSGNLVSINQAPTTEGAIVCYRAPGTRLGELYVTVSIENVPTWVPVSARTVISDAATGKAWDPLANQYSILAY